MSDGALDQQSTLLLAARFIRVSKELDAINHAVLWRKPIWWLTKRFRILEPLRRWKLKRLILCNSALLGELSVRYDGIMRDLFICAGAGTSFDDYQHQVWIEFQDRAARARDPRRFSTCLWEIQRRLGSTVNELKPKFMLRQFVDDMPEGEPRAALKLFAYSFQVHWPHAGEEAARMVKKGYALLHERVRARASDLELLTGGVLDASAVGQIRSPYAQYDEWLFYEC